MKGGWGVEVERRGGGGRGAGESIDGMSIICLTDTRFELNNNSLCPICNQ